VKKEYVGFSGYFSGFSPFPLSLHSLSLQSHYSQGYFANLSVFGPFSMIYFVVYEKLKSYGLFRKNDYLSYICILYVILSHIYNLGQLVLKLINLIKLLVFFFFVFFFDKHSQLHCGRSNSSSSDFSFGRCQNSFTGNKRERRKRRSMEVQRLEGAWKYRG
jgi:hypothetical protein